MGRDGPLGPFVGVRGNRDTISCGGPSARRSKSRFGARCHVAHAALGAGLRSAELTAEARPRPCADRRSPTMPGFGRAFDPEAQTRRELSRTETFGRTRRGHETRAERVPSSWAIITSALTGWIGG